MNQTPKKSLTLYSFFKSSASWRVRLALSFKNLEYEYIPINLHNKDQAKPEYLKINPMGVRNIFCREK